MPELSWPKQGRMIMMTGNLLCVQILCVTCQMFTVQHLISRSAKEGICLQITVVNLLLIIQLTVLSSDKITTKPSHIECSRH